MATIKKINRKHARHVIEQSMAALGLDMNMETDPAIVKSLLREMRLDDFQTDFAPMKKFFADALAKPQGLQPMFKSIIDGICNKHPAIVEFAELALKKKWFSPSPHILRAAHVTYILEAMTAAMCNNHHFFLAAQDHIKSKEKMCGIDSRHIVQAFIRGFGICHSVFETIKALSVDAAMILFRTRHGLSDSQLDREILSILQDKEGLNFVESKLLSRTAKNDLEHILKWIRINIYEAGITEYEKGFEDNAFCAQELNEDIQKNSPDTLFLNTKVVPENSMNAFYQSLTNNHNLFPTFRFSKEWMSLYITWNMAFVLGDLDNVDLMMPKLLIPSVINAQNEHFLGTRAVSLWLSINSFLFRSIDSSALVTGPDNKKEMASAWGKINEKYALELARNQTHEAPQTLLKGFRHFFSFPLFNFLKAFGDFSIH